MQTSLLYDNSIFVQNPVTLKWRGVKIESWPNEFADSTFPSRTPTPRYLSAMAFVSKNIFEWRTKYSERKLFDEKMKSSQTNKQGTISDSLLIFGGFDGTSGPVYDGSSGGLLSDMWIVRLGEYSSISNAAKHGQYLDNSCRWRSNVNSTKSCLSDTPMAECDFRDLIMLPWCDKLNQTMT